MVFVESMDKQLKSNIMKNKQGYSIIPLLIIVVVTMSICSCEKDNDKPSPENPTNGKTTAIFNADITYGTMTDQDGNVYKTVSIGPQTWMAENLRTTKYNDGTAIPRINDDTEWASSNIGSYCNYNNTISDTAIATYGRLYNWHAVNTGKLCPDGWLVPTNFQWQTLGNILGNADVISGKLKEIGTTHWFEPELPNEASNETGFTALPGGRREINGLFDNIGQVGSWWSATEYTTNWALYWSMTYNGSSLYKSSESKEPGFSVRCMSDY